MTREERDRRLKLSAVEAGYLVKVRNGGGWIRNADEPLARRSREFANGMRARKMVEFETTGESLYTRVRLSQVGRIALRRWELDRAVARRERRAA